MFIRMAVEISLFLFVLGGITCVFDAFFVIAWQVYFLKPKFHQEPGLHPNSLPFISVMVAARNEEANLSRCLQSLLNMEYPISRMEILVGNDSSSDHTLQIALEYASRFPELIKVKDIQSTLNPHVKGKANVLAQLCRKAQGEFFFFTDADIEVPKLWIKTMLANFDNPTGIITGFTGITGTKWLSKFQNVDWFFALGIVKIFSDMGKPVTSMGNNMVVRREAYEAVGGYESIPFSITEDFELFRQILKKGYKGKHLLDKNIICWSQPKESVMEILRQRKRWMFGAIETHFYMLSVLIAQALFFPAVAGLLILYPLAVVVLFVSKAILQSVFIYGVFKKAEVKIDWKYLFFYEFYSVFLSLSLMVYFMLPVGVEWKGRKY